MSGRVAGARFTQTFPKISPEITPLVITWLLAPTGYLAAKTRVFAGSLCRRGRGHLPQLELLVGGRVFVVCFGVRELLLSSPSKAFRWLSCHYSLPAGFDKFRGL